MRKGIKILIGVLVLVVVLIVTYIVLIIKGILPNPFLDTSDLVCSKKYIGTEDCEQIIVKFDKNAVIKEYIEKQIISFSSNEEAKNIYEKEYEDIVNNQDILYKKQDSELIDNKIISSFYYEVKETDNKYKKTKKEIIELYESDYMYECE